MSKSFRFAGAGLVALGALMAGSPSFAAPLYIGVSLNGGATIDHEQTSSTGTDVFTTSDGTFSSIVVTAQGTPPNPEPTLLSNTIDFNSSGAGTLTVLITGTNEFPLVPGFLSSFTSNSLPSGWSVTEATYVNNCAAPLPSACGTYPSSDVFNTTNLLSSTTFTAAGASSSGVISPIKLQSDYAITEVFTITATGAGSTNDTIDLVATPLPGALPLFAGGLGVLGLLARRKKKTVATI